MSPFPRIPRLAIPALASLLLIALASAPILAEPPPSHQTDSKKPQATSNVRENWYAVSIGGKRSGWMRDTITTTDATISRDQEMSFTIKRERLEMTVTSRTTFVESTDGHPISMSLTQSMGANPTTTEYTFQPEGIQSTTITKMGRQATMLPAIKDAWLTPTQIEALIKEKIKDGTTTFTYQSVNPATGVTIVTETRDEKSREARTIDGKTIQVVTYAVKNSAAPGLPMTESVDEHGEVLEQEFSTGAFTIKINRSTRALAMGSFEAPEIMVKTYIVPDQPIQSPRSLKHATYILSVPDGEPLELPSTGTQRPEKLPDHRVRLALNATTGSPATISGKEREAALASTILADAKDDKVLALVAKATKDAGDSQPARAEAMRRFVHRFINTKNLSVGFASASETARSAVGDCTEHGVLLAAMLRADHIPSRVASGLIYVDHLAGAKGAFGYHLWAQALLTIDGEERWIDLDPTLDDLHPFDATHIALALSDLSDGDTLTSMVSIVPLLGRLKIEVVPDAAPSKDPSHAR